MHLSFAKLDVLTSTGEGMFKVTIHAVSGLVLVHLQYYFLPALQGCFHLNGDDETGVV